MTIFRVSVNHRTHQACKLFFNGFLRNASIVRTLSVTFIMIAAVVLCIIEVL